MKYYAIRTIDGENVNKILTSWDECKALEQGDNCEYKSFKVKTQAIDYIGDYKKEEKENDVLDSEKYVYYVDGSYLNNNIGWGFILTKHNEELVRMSGGIIPNENTSRNITGELTASIMAVRHAISNGFKEIYLVNDYQ